MATYLDPVAKMKKFNFPVGGCIIKALETATGKKSSLVGKPNPIIFEILEKDKGVNLSRCLMIGDNLESDILLAKKGGVDSFLVLSGVSKYEDLEKEFSN